MSMVYVFTLKKEETVVRIGNNQFVD